MCFQHFFPPPTPLISGAACMCASRLICYAVILINFTRVGTRREKYRHSASGFDNKSRDSFRNAYYVLSPFRNTRRFYAFHFIFSSEVKGISCIVERRFAIACIAHCTSFTNNSIFRIEINSGFSYAALTLLPSRQPLYLVADRQRHEFTTVVTEVNI